MAFSPMLAPQDDPLKRKTFFQDLPFPLLCSPKYDGIRGVATPRGVISRTGKLLPSFQVQDEFNFNNWLDFEIIEGDPCTPDCYNRTQSHVMSLSKPGDLKIFVFDSAHPDLRSDTFRERLDVARHMMDWSSTNLFFVEHTLVHTLEELLVFEDKQVEAGFEGIMMRTPHGKYKDYSRCTWNDHIIFKLKRFQDDEGLLVDIEEKMENKNAQERDERGYAKRSSSKEGLVPAGMVGTFIVDFKGQILRVAPGSFKHNELTDIFLHPEKYLGNILKFRHFTKGVKDLPRFPRALGFRDRMDM